MENLKIKFRGWSIEDQKWVYGFYYNIQEKEHYILQPCVLGLLHTQVEEESVSQFTGLQDKDKMDIYGGDILKKINSSNKRESDLYVVRYISYCWKILNKYQYNSLYTTGGEQKLYEHTYSLGTYEIVGNLFQNENLIKQ